MISASYTTIIITIVHLAEHRSAHMIPWLGNIKYYMSMYLLYSLLIDLIHIGTMYVDVCLFITYAYHGSKQHSPKPSIYFSIAILVVVYLYY